MGNTDSTQRLGERVLAGKTKLEQDRKIQSERYKYLKANSPQILDTMVDSVADSFATCSPFLEPTLLIAWIHNPERCKEIVLRSCRSVLSAPIKKTEYFWFKEYVFESSVWMFKTKQNEYMYRELLNIAKNMSHDIIDSMDSIYAHLELHRKWTEMMNIQNQLVVLRQDHNKVGLLKEKGLRDVFESKKKDDDTEDMKSFIDSNVAINILTSAATTINPEFQNHVKTVMCSYGDFQPGPMKKVQRCVGKLENDYSGAQYPKSAKLLDLVRCSVTFNTVDQLINGYNGLMKHIAKYSHIIELARVKNGFLNTMQSGGGGYRDIKVNVIYKSQTDPSSNLKMICEIQLLLINYLQEKKRIHKLYSIVREEIYFQMVVKVESSRGQTASKGLSDLEFKDALSVTDVPLQYTNSFNKCSVDPQLGLLCMEGINWFGVVDMAQNKPILEMERDSPSHPWYGRQSHQWIVIEDHKYLSVQMGKTQIKMFQVKTEKEKTEFEFVENKKYTITVPSGGVINYCDFDSKFENILLITDNVMLQKRSMRDVNRITDSIKLKETINQSSFRNLRISNDGTLCGLGGGSPKNYFYLIDIANQKQHKLTSRVLSDTYSPCFINGENEYISVSDKKGRIEIWNIEQKRAINTLSIGASQWVTSAASTNNILAVGSWDKKLRLYDVRNWECFYTHTYTIKPNSLHLTADLQYLTVGGTGGDRCFVLKIE